MKIDVSYGINLGWGGPTGDYIGFWAGPSKGYTTNLVQGSCAVYRLCFTVYGTFPCQEASLGFPKVIASFAFSTARFVTSSYCMRLMF